MIYYANPTNAGPTGDAVRDLMVAGELGCITTPDQGNVTFPDEWDVIADNGCYVSPKAAAAGRVWSEAGWWSWLLDQPRSVRFAVCPDVFHPDGSPCHEPTLERWREWAPKMRRHGFTPAFVLQVGCSTYEQVPDDAEVLFIGGTDPYKLNAYPFSGQVGAITRQANEDGRWVHMGRVNSGKRFRAARAMGGVGCDSVDGTYLTYGANTNLPKLMSWLADADRSPMLHEVTS